MTALFAALSPEQIEVGTRLVAGAVGLAAAMLGLPVALVQFQKTKAEIRKLNMEAEKLQQTAAASAQMMTSDGLRISVEGKNNTIVISRDPRMAGPLLVMIDFVISTIIVLVFGRVVDVFGMIGDGLTVLVAIILYLPVFRSARRVQKFLRDEVSVDPATLNAEHTKSEDA